MAKAGKRNIKQNSKRKNRKREVTTGADKPDWSQTPAKRQKWADQNPRGKFQSRPKSVEKTYWRQ